MTRSKQTQWAIHTRIMKLWRFEPINMQPIKNEILIPHEIGGNGVLHMNIFNGSDDSESPCSFSGGNSILLLVVVTNDTGTWMASSQRALVASTGMSSAMWETRCFVLFFWQLRLSFAANLQAKSVSWAPAAAAATRICCLPRVQAGKELIPSESYLQPPLPEGEPRSGREGESSS